MSKLSDKCKQLNLDAKHQNKLTYSNEHQSFIDSFEDFTPSQYQQRAIKKQSLKHFHSGGIPTITNNET